MYLRALARLLAGVFLLGSFPLLAADTGATSCLLPKDAVVELTTIKRVIDGDTVVLANGDRARLIGINTPERKYSRKMNALNGAEPYYQEAKNALEGYINNSAVKIVAGQHSQDRYGRRLVYLYSIEGVFLPGELIRAGLGFRTAFPSDLVHQACLQRLEKWAKDNQKGIWSSQYWLTDSENITGAGFQILEGKVASVNESRYFWWVDLQGSATLKVSKKRLEKPQAYRLEGRLLRARGWLVDRRKQDAVKNKGYKPWMMNITDMSNIKIMKTLP